MDFQEFTEKVKEEVGKRLEMQVQVKRVQRNNGVTLTGLVIMDSGSNTSPAIYLNSYYEGYQKEDDIREAAGDICRIYKSSSIKRPVDLSNFLTFEKAKGQIAFRLVNYEKNTERLYGMPHRRFLDLAIIYYYVVKEPPFDGRASIQISNSHMETWSVTESELYKTAMSNTPQLQPLAVEGIDGCIRGILDKELKKVSDGDGDVGRIFLKMLLTELILSDSLKVPMYVMTNKENQYGAACILYPDSIKGFADKIGSDLYIFPSSVHEVILVSAGEGEETEKLYAMVREINREQVDLEEQLSDNVYIYRRAEGMISLA